MSDMSTFFGNIFGNYIQPVLNQFLGQEATVEEIPTQQKDSNKRKASEIDTFETEHSQELQSKRLKVNDHRLQDVDLRCKTSSWQNNCGLNCLTHLLFNKLENNELQRKFSHHQAYQTLLQTFQEYYALPVLPTWDEVKNLLAAFEAPHDREAILAPVLRKHLGKVMAHGAKTFWNVEGSAAFSEYLSSGEVNDIAEPIYLANKTFFCELKQGYDAAVASSNTESLTDAEVDEALKQLEINKKLFVEDKLKENLTDQIKFNRRNKIEAFYQGIAEDYWINGEGYRNYIDYITDLNNAVMVSADQLQLLCQHLDIKAEVYVHDNAQNMPEGNFTWTIKVHNTGVHWEYQEPDSDAEKKEAHNQYYPTEFYGTEPVFGQFKTYAHPDDDQLKKIKDIKAYVINQMGSQLMQPGVSAPLIFSALNNDTSNRMSISSPDDTTKNIKKEQFPFL